MEANIFMQHFENLGELDFELKSINKWKKPAQISKDLTSSDYYCCE